MWIYCGDHCNQLCALYEKSQKLYAVNTTANCVLRNRSHVESEEATAKKRRASHWWENQEKWAIARNLCRILTKKKSKNEFPFFRWKMHSAQELAAPNRQRWRLQELMHDTCVLRICRNFSLMEFFCSCRICHVVIASRKKSVHVKNTRQKIQ